MLPTLLLGMPEGGEWIVILIIVLLLFGNKIPGVARSLGAGVNEFKAGLREGVDKPASDGKSGAPEKTDKVDTKGS
jgi:sec-independent protein translocase protein TatA